MRGVGTILGLLLKWTMIATLIRGALAFGGDLRRSRQSKANKHHKVDEDLIDRT